MATQLLGVRKMMEQRECPRASLTYGKTLAPDRRVDWNG